MYRLQQLEKEEQKLNTETVIPPLKSFPAREWQSFWKEMIEQDQESQRDVQNLLKNFQQQRQKAEDISIKSSEKRDFFIATLADASKALHHSACLADFRRANLLEKKVVLSQSKRFSEISRKVDEQMQGVWERQEEKIAFVDENIGALQEVANEVKTYQKKAEAVVSGLQHSMEALQKENSESSRQAQEAAASGCRGRA